MLNGKAMIIYLTVGLTKRYCYIETSNLQVKLDLTNYATKYDLNMQ